MQSDVVRCAVIGAGLLGMRHAQFLATRANTKLVAVADVRATVVEEAARRTGANPYLAYEEMLTKEALDLVLVETPDNQHRVPAIACCEASVRNLVVQKPLATTVADGRAIVAAAERAGTRVFVWYENRAFGTDMATQYAIREGLIGTVVYGDCDTDNSIYTPLSMWGERSRDWVSGSSPANFLASHIIDRLLWYFAPAHIDKVFALSQRKVLGHTPDLYDVFLFFDTELKVRVKVGWIHRIEGKIESAELFNGIAGQIYNHRHPRFNMVAGWRVNVADGFDFAGLLRHQQALRERGIGSRVVQNQLPATGWADKGPLGLEVPLAEAPKHELLQFIIDGVIEDSLTPQSWRRWQGDSPLPGADDALENVAVITAIERSAATGEPVAVERE